MSSSSLSIERIETMGMPTLRLVGALDIHTRCALEFRLDELVQLGHARVGLDLRQLTFLDSEGVRTIVAAWTEWQRLERVIILLETSTVVTRVFRLLKLGDFLTWMTPAPCAVPAS